MGNVATSEFVTFYWGPPGTGGRLQPVLMRHPPSYLSKLGGQLGGSAGGLGGGGGSAGGSRGGVRPWGGIPKVGGPMRDPQQPHAYF